MDRVQGDVGNKQREQLMTEPTLRFEVALNHEEPDKNYTTFAFLDEVRLKVKQSVDRLDPLDEQELEQRNSLNKVVSR